MAGDVVVVVGAVLATVRVNVRDEREVAPFAVLRLCAVIVYVVADDNCVGVPEINPVVVSNVKPVGRAGEIE